MPFCLPNFQAEDFLKRLKSGEIDPQDLASKSSEERRAYFAEFLGETNAKQVNALFESKLLLKDQQRGIINWAKQVAGMKPETLRDIVAKVNRMTEVLNPKDQDSFLEDLAAQRLGTAVTMEEAAKISELAQKAAAAKETGQKLSGVSDEYMKARNELKDYVASRKPLSTPLSILKNLAIIGRNNLLLNPSTPLKSIAGQVINASMDFITRRISSQSLVGENPDLASQAGKEAWETFRKTGNNTASMESMNDTHMLGTGENFKLPNGENQSGRVMSGIETAVRKTAQLSNKVAIDWEHNLTFTKFYQKTFFDMVNLSSSHIAKGEGLNGAEAKTRAATIFKDAARIEPKTAEGALVRMEAQKQAARITSTNETLTSRFALGAKNALNGIIPGVPIGDFILPIAKIPASIIANGIDSAGAGLPKAVVDISKGRADIQSDDLQTRYEGMAQFSNGIQRLMRIGGTLGVAALLARSFKKDDFRSDNYGNHFVRIGNVWINMQYVSAISPALAGMMSVKQKGHGASSDAAQYAMGTLSSLKGTPGIDEASQLVASMTTSGGAAGAVNYAKTFFTSRGVPAFIPNLLKGNPIQHLFFGSTGAETDRQYKAETKAKAKATAAKAKATRAANKKN